MMRFLPLLLISGLVFADDPCPDMNPTPLDNVVKELAIPNCFTLRKLNLAVKGKVSPLCGECRESFYTNSALKAEKENPIEAKKKAFFDIAFQEYKKSLTNELVEIVKLRSLPTTGSTFSKATNQCSFKGSDAFKGCSPQMKSKLEGPLKDLQSSLASELAQTLSGQKPKDRTTGILDRDNTKNYCFIPEYEIQYYSNAALEDLFTPEIFDKMQSLSGQKFTTMDDLFSALESKNISTLSTIRDRFSSNPLLAIYTKDPKSFLTVIAHLDPRNSTGLRKELYSAENGEKLDQEIASHCEEAFEAFSQSICSSDFSKGDFSFNPYSKLNSLNNNLNTSEEDIASTPALIESNTKAMSYCDAYSQDGKIDGDKELDKISESIGNVYSQIPLKQFTKDKYDQDTSLLNQKLCAIKADPSKCVKGTFECSVFEKLNKPSEFDSKLAASSNKEINDLLRSFIGKPSNLSSETKEVLVANGIIPKDDGTLVAQADIPERKADYFKKTTTPSTKTASSSSRVEAGGSSSSSYSSRASAATSNGAYTQNALYNPSNDSYPDFSDIMKDSDDNLRQVQDEIMRRLKGLPNKRPSSKDEARQITRDAFKKTNQRLTPDMEDAFSSQMMASNSTPTPSAAPANSPDAELFNRSNQIKKVASTNTKSAAQKYSEDGMNRALADMQGARSAASNRAPASVNAEGQEKSLTKVAMNINEDPKVSLSKIFSDKLNKNDPETQLLKVLMNNKKDFLLQVKNMNFKIVFDEKSNMNILLESGDKQEAARLRPQLEIFFNRLKAL